MREKPRKMGVRDDGPSGSAPRAPSLSGATTRCERLERFTSPRFAVIVGGSERSHPPPDSTGAISTSEPHGVDRRPHKPSAALQASVCESQTQTQSNPLLQLTNTDAAQSVILPLCLLSVFAAEQHVGRIRRPSATTPRISESAFPER